MKTNLPPNFDLERKSVICQVQSGLKIGKKWNKNCSYDFNLHTYQKHTVGPCMVHPNYPKSKIFHTLQGSVVLVYSHKKNPGLSNFFYIFRSMQG